MREIVAQELRTPSWPAVDAAAAAVRDRHGDTVAAVLFYGSCLRDRQDEGRLLDFYVFTDRYRDFHGRSLLAAANRILPPNVYFLETPYDGRTVRAKYAVLSLPALRRQTRRRTFLPTLWARLSQPGALVYARDATAEANVVEALASSIETLIAETAPLMEGPFTAAALWTRAFSETYRTELRPERSNRPAQIYAWNPDRYDRMTDAVLSAGAVPGLTKASDGTLVSSTTPTERAKQTRRWTGRRAAGRLVHVARLAKATMTFTDGLDYALYKIATHSGITVEPTAWQRRHPLLAAPGLALRLYRRGAFR